jgi:hypothetical protein
MCSEGSVTTLFISNTTLLNVIKDSFYLYSRLCFRSERLGNKQTTLSSAPNDLSDKTIRISESKIRFFASILSLRILQTCYFSRFSLQKYY